MIAFITFMGWFTVAMLCLAFSCGMVCLVFFCYQKAMEAHDRAVRVEYASELGRQISAAGWWFSEHPQTSLAIRILGDRLLNGLSASPDHWRDQWHKGRDPRDKVTVSEE